MISSESITKIAAALVALQAELTNPAFDSTNPHFNSKYASLAGIINHLKEPCAKHGLATIQSAATNAPAEGSPRTGVTTRIIHTSGEWIETDAIYLRDRKDDAQGAVASITYARRASLCAAYNIAADADDDGNSISGEDKEAVWQKSREEFTTLSKALTESGSKEDLAVVAEAIKTVQALIAEHKNQLRDLYAARLKEMEE